MTPTEIGALPFRFISVNAELSDGQPTYSRSAVRSHAARAVALRRDARAFRDHRTSTRSQGRRLVPAKILTEGLSPIQRKWSIPACQEAVDDTGRSGTSNTFRRPPVERQVPFDLTRAREDTLRPVSVVDYPAPSLRQPDGQLLDISSFALYETEVSELLTSVLDRSIQGFCHAFGREAPLPKARFEAMASNQAAFTAMCAVLFAIHEDLQNQHEPHITDSTSGRQASRRVATYTTIAIQQLQKEHMSAGTDGAGDGVLIAIACLSALAIKMGDMRQHDWHRQAIGQTVQKRGGLSKIGGAARSTILATEFYSALETEDTVINELHEKYELPLNHVKKCGESDAGPSAEAVVHSEPSLQSAFIDEDTLQQLPEGFQILARRRLLSQSSIALVCSIAAYQKRLKWHHKLSCPHPAAPDLQNNRASSLEMNGSNFDCKHELKHDSLFDACPDVFADAINNKKPLTWPGINVMISLGLLLYSQIALNDCEIWYSVTVWPLVHQTRAILTKKLLAVLRPQLSPASPWTSSRSAADTVRNLEIENLLHWLTFLTIASWKTSTGVLSNRGLDLAAAAARRLVAYESLYEPYAQEIAYKENWLRRNFLWSEKFDTGLVETSIRACAASQNFEGGPNGG